MTDAPRSQGVTLPAEPTSAARARRFLRQLLGTWGCDPLEETAALLLTELVANALLHAKSEVRVRVLLLDDVLRVEVADDSPRLPRRRRYGLDATTGRGLSLVSAMSRSWGSTRRGPGKVVWFEVDGSPVEDRQATDAAGSTGGPVGTRRTGGEGPAGGTPGPGLGRNAGPAASRAEARSPDRLAAA